jgi:hypothetical protein
MEYIEMKMCWLSVFGKWLTTWWAGSWLVLLSEDCIFCIAIISKEQESSLFQISIWDHALPAMTNLINKCLPNLAF